MLKKDFSPLASENQITLGLGDSIAKVMALKNQFHYVLGEISASSAQEVIPYYFFRKYSAGDKDSEEEALEFCAAILALLDFGVDPETIIDTKLPLNFLVQNAIQMGLVLKAYNIFKCLLNHSAITPELKKNIENYLCYIETAGSMSFEEGQNYSYRFDGETIIHGQVAPFIYEEVLERSPAVLDLPSQKQLAKLYWFDFESHLPNKDTDPLILLTKACLNDSSPNADRCEELIQNVVVNEKNVLLLPILLQKLTLSNVAIEKIISVMINFDELHPDWELKYPFSSELVPVEEQHQESFRINCEIISASFYMGLIECLPKEEALSLEVLANLKDAQEKSNRFVNMLNKCGFGAFSAATFEAYPKNFSELAVLILHHTPTEHLAENISVIFNEIDENHPDQNQKIEAYFRIIIYVAESNEKTSLFLLIFNHLRKNDEYCLFHLLAEKEPLEFVKLVGGLLASPEIDFEQKIKPLLEIRNRLGLTPLDLLVFYKPSEFIELMTQLFASPEIDFEQKIKPLLEIQNRAGITPFVFLPFRNPSKFIELITLLLASPNIDFQQKIKPSLEIQDIEGDTPLSILALSASASVFRWLIDLLSAKDINFEQKIKPLLEIQASDGNTPLHRLVRDKPLEFIEFMTLLLASPEIDFEQKIKPLLEIQNTKGITLLDILALNEPSEFIQLITQLLAAEDIDFDKRIKPLLEIQNTEGITLLDMLALNEPSEFIKLMTQLLASPEIDFEQKFKHLFEIKNKNNATTLHMLAFSKPSEFIQLITQLLAAENIDFDKRIKPLFEIQDCGGSTPLHILAVKNPSKFIQLMMQLLARPEIDFEQKIKPLLEIQGRNGNTLLHILAAHKPLEFIEFMTLLLASPEIDFEQKIKPLLEKQNTNGITPLYILAGKNPSEFIELMTLLLASPNIDFEQQIKPLLEIQDKDGNTPLHRLTADKASEFIKLMTLLLASPNIDFEQQIKPLLEKQNTNGITPLHILAPKNPSEAVWLNIGNRSQRNFYHCNSYKVFSTFC